MVSGGVTSVKTNTALALMLAGLSSSLLRRGTCVAHDGGSEVCYRFSYC